MPGFAPPGAGASGGQGAPGEHGTPPGYAHGYAPPPGYGPSPGHGPAPGSGTHPGYAPPPGQGDPYGRTPPPGYGAAPGHGTPPGYGPPPGYAHGYAQGPGYGPPGYAPPPGPGSPGGRFGPAPHTPESDGLSPEPVRPGVVALRPMSLGDVFNGAFGYVRQNPRTTFLLSLIVMAIASIVGSIAATWSTSDSLSTLSMFDQIMADPEAFDPDDPMYASSPIATLLGFTGSLINLVGMAVLTGMLSGVVGMAVLGRRLTVEQARAVVRGRVGSVIALAFIRLGIQIVIWVVVFVALMVALFVGLIIGFGMADPTAGVIIAVLISLLALAVICAPAAWIWVRLYYAMPLIVLERLGAGQAMARSWRLSQGAWWRTFGYWLLSGAVVVVVNLILTMPLGFAIALLFEIDTFGPVLAGVVNYVVTVLIYALTLPFLAGVNTLLCVDLRMRGEGLDLQLNGIAQRGQPVGSEVFLPGYRA
ncbi:glycerophosphoryl diester phosphodiesterase membrane domain-containing protein [Nocardiopsis sp. NPDC006938]|uniref:glycerophosphoryl diester phosphodiesterase membrane domain-containing protein n=1 Tax=Nocardiopsis sp. NPDC006938 TaxID=3364337 RepID=UPI00367EC437